MGGRLVWLEGFWEEPYGRRDAVLGNFHRGLHVVTAVAAPPTPAPQRHLEALRFSIVLWSKEGKFYPRTRAVEALTSSDMTELARVGEELMKKCVCLRTRPSRRLSRTPAHENGFARQEELLRHEARWDVVHHVSSTG